MRHVGVRVAFAALWAAGCDDGGAGRGSADAADARAPADMAAPAEDARRDQGAPPRDAARDAAIPDGARDEDSAIPDAARDASAVEDGRVSDAAHRDAAVRGDAAPTDAFVAADAARRDAAAARDARPDAPTVERPDGAAADASPDGAPPADALADGAPPADALGDGAPPADALADGAPPADAAPDAAPPCARRVQVTVRDEAGAPIERARVTLVEAPERFFEARTGPDGTAVLDDVPAGAYDLGASAPGRAYVEQQLLHAGDCPAAELALGPEVERGRWDVLGDPGERLGGTNSGVLLADGRIMWCHDTRDPVIFDPAADAAGRFRRAADSMRIQGCHAVSALPDGRLLYVGGTDREVYGPGTRQVKVYAPVLDRWTAMEDPRQLLDPRWYPSLAPLAGGGFIAMGGGGLDNPRRIRSSEVYDPDTMQWRRVGDLAIGNEVSPVVLLFTGEVLMTHRPPQLYDPDAEQWRLSADFVQHDRMANGDHADHEVVLLPDGRVVAVGFKSFVHGQPGRMLELYDPDANRWSLGADLRPVRSRPSIVLLPDTRVLILGGAKEEANDPTPVNAWNQVALTDLYDPASDGWRRLADLNIAREYHVMPVLLPDGRVVVAGGEGAPGNAPARSTAEAFSPPYLFRGPRPRIVDVDRVEARPGDRLRVRFAGTNAPTRVVLAGAIATTHFMDSGPGRHVDLRFEQAGDELLADVPLDPARAIPGIYLLFVMVDDIPSVARVVRIQRPL